MCPQDLWSTEHIPRFSSGKPKGIFPLQIKYVLKPERYLDVRCKFCSKACFKAIYGVSIITCHMFGRKPHVLDFQGEEPF